jgi:dephospho-CoA kinase
MKLQNAPYVIKEAALIFEAGAAAGLDLIIGVTAPTAIRIQRVMHRDGISREAVLERMDKQIDESIKMRLCDFVIQNDNQHLLTTQVLDLHNRFTS